MNRDTSVCQRERERERDMMQPLDLFLLPYKSCMMFHLFSHNEQDGSGSMKKKERKKERKFKSCFSFGLCTSGSLQHDHSPTFVSPVWVFLLRTASFLSYTRMHWVMCTAAGVEFWSFLSRVGVSVNVSEDDPLSSSSISGRAVECCHSLVFSGHCRLGHRESFSQ